MLAVIVDHHNVLFEFDINCIIFNCIDGECEGKVGDVKEFDEREPRFVGEHVFHAALKGIEAYICRNVEADYFVAFDLEYKEFGVVFEVVSVRSDSEGKAKC